MKRNKRISAYHALALLALMATLLASCRDSNEPEIKPEVPATGMVAVDLDLPSGVKWANKNVGAVSAEDYGCYYQWGGSADLIKTDINVIWAQYFQAINGSGTDSPDCGDQAKDPLWQYVGKNPKAKETICSTGYDIAHRKWGGKWRMPTYQEVEELLDTFNCTPKWTTQNGVYGLKVTSKTNNNSIFLPAAGYRSSMSLINATTHGYYWTGSSTTVNAYSAFDMEFSSSRNAYAIYGRFEALTIRPVTE